MSTPDVTTEQFVTLARRGQEATTAAVQGVARALLTEAGEAVTAQASVAGETLKARTEEATERVVDFTAQSTRRAATAARNGVSV